MDEILITVVTEDGGERLVPAPGAGDSSGKSLLEILQGAGVYIPAICGGRGTCGKCRIRLTAGELEPSAACRAYFSEAEIEAGFRFACSVRPAASVTLAVPKDAEKEFHGVDSFDAVKQRINALEREVFSLKKQALSFARQAAGDRRGGLSLDELGRIAVLAETEGGTVSVYRERGRVAAVIHGKEAVYGIGVDIGTTTLAMALVDLESGEIKQRLSVVNKQREFGADVISRMERAGKGDLSKMSGAVRAQIAAGAETLCQEEGVSGKAVVKFAIAGNTTMLHLLLNLSCATLGVVPFTPVTLDFVSCAYRELFEGDISCPVVILPGISTYVGADISAGLFFTELHKSAEPVFFMDIGTNGEMALVKDGKLLCTATAAGPAFEGGNILWGTGSVPGAISQASYSGGKFDIKTIGGKPPAGICGSAVIDIVYHGLLNGLIESSGKFAAGIGDLVLAKNPAGEEIKFIQKDVRELQLAKSAIRSGMEALLHYTGTDSGAVKTLYIAGGFGFNMNFESGAGIGLIPQELKSRVSLIGNSSLGGTVKYLLDSGAGEKIEEIVGLSQEYSLPEDRYFNEIFIENVEFE
ncbi:MAG: ASKHA domain-containing protein [Treponema sp.]|nr:ASKHA domain-containing protein [Treponema sp.]